MIALLIFVLGVQVYFIYRGMKFKQYSMVLMNAIFAMCTMFALYRNLI